MPNTHQKRSEILKVYKTETWKERVMKMGENQVHAIYSRFRKEGKIK